MDKRKKMENKISKEEVKRRIKHLSELESKEVNQVRVKNLVKYKEILKCRQC